jgi:hypothetical protein
MKRGTFIAVALIVLMALLPTMVSAQPFINIAEGSQEVVHSYKAKPRGLVASLIWQPTLPAWDSLGWLVAVCDLDEKQKGKYRVEAVLIRSVDDETVELAAGPVSRAIKKNGKGKGVLWDLTPHLSDFEGHSGVVMIAQFKAVKKVKAFTGLKCTLSMLEMWDGNAPITDSTAYGEYLTGFVRGGPLSR